MSAPASAARRSSSTAARSCFRFSIRPLPVNLKTLRLEVARGGPDSLITKDRMRVDIGAEFYLRVKPDSSSIALAAQTLGSRTNNAGELRELIEAKFVDGLRSVAATMNLEELQEQRATFVKSGAGGGRRRHPEQRPRARVSVADAARPERHQAFQPEQFLRRARPDDADQDHPGARTGAQPDRPHHRGEHRPAGPRRPPDHADDRGHQARGGTGAAARHRQQDRAMRAQTAQVEQTALQNEAEYRIQQELAVANKQTEANQCATPARSKPISR
jgi:flotillin